jgi:hypothetical protein
VFVNNARGALFTNTYKTFCAAKPRQRLGRESENVENQTRSDGTQKEESKGRSPLVRISTIVTAGNEIEIRKASPTSTSCGIDGLAANDIADFTRF